MSHFVFSSIFSTPTLSITSNLQLITFRFYPLIEVLTARQSLLAAQQTLIQDRAAKIQSVIDLYRALGFPVD